MDELTIAEMSNSRIVKTLQELKSEYSKLACKGRVKHKYYFALGHAIRAIKKEG